MAVAVAVSACSSSSPKASADAASLCASVRVWNDQSVDTVNEFSLHTDEVDASGRRRLYDEAFVHLGDRLTALAAQIDALPKGDLRDAMESAHGRMAANLASARSDAAA